MIFSRGVPRVITSTYSGTLKYFSIINSTSSFRVAENIKFCLFNGKISKIFNNCDLNPRFNISSTSSITNFLTALNCKVRLKVKSIKRPGVATNISKPSYTLCF